MLDSLRSNTEKNKVTFKYQVYVDIKKQSQIQLLSMNEYQNIPNYD